MEKKRPEKKTVEYLDENHILFGTDTFTEELNHMDNVLENDRELFKELDWSKQRRNKILGDKLQRFLD